MQAVMEQPIKKFSFFSPDFPSLSPGDQLLAKEPDDWVRDCDPHYKAAQTKTIQNNNYYEGKIWPAFMLSV